MYPQCPLKASHILRMSQITAVLTCRGEQRLATFMQMPAGTEFAIRYSTMWEQRPATETVVVYSWWILWYLQRKGWCNAQWAEQKKKSSKQCMMTICGKTSPIKEGTLLTSISTQKSTLIAPVNKTGVTINKSKRIILILLFKRASHFSAFYSQGHGLFLFTRYCSKKGDLTVQTKYMALLNRMETRVVVITTVAVQARTGVSLAKRRGMTMVTMGGICVKRRQQIRTATSLPYPEWSEAYLCESNVQFPWRSPTEQSSTYQYTSRCNHQSASFQSTHNETILDG